MQQPLQSPAQTGRTCAMLLTVAVASMFWGCGFSDTAVLACGVLDVYFEPVLFRDTDVWPINPSSNIRNRIGAAFGLPTINMGAGPILVSVPLWVPFVVLGVASASLWRAGRIPPGHCRRCGYDLRASMERCPECGEPVEAVK